MYIRTIQKYIGIGIFFVLFLFGFVIMAFAQTESLSNLEIASQEIVAARVLNSEKINQNLNQRIENAQGYRIIEIEKITVRILEGKHKDVVYTLENTVAANTNNIHVTTGDKLLVQVNELNNGTFEVVIQDKYRINTFYLYGLLFMIVLVLIYKTSIIKILLLFGLMSGGLYWMLTLLTHTNQGYLFFIPLLVLSLISSIIIFGFHRKTFLSIIGIIFGVTVSFILFQILQPVLLGKYIINSFGIADSAFRGILFISILNMLLWCSIITSKITLLSIESMKYGKKYIDFLSLYFSLWKYIKIRLLYVFTLIILCFYSFLFVFVDIIDNNVISVTYTTLLNQEIFLFALLLAIIIFSAIASTAFLICFLIAQNHFGFVFSKQEKLL